MRALCVVTLALLFIASAAFSQAPLDQSGTYTSVVTANINRYVKVERLSDDWNLSFGNLDQTKVGDTVADDEVRVIISSNEELFLDLRANPLRSTTRVRQGDNSLAYAELETYAKGWFYAYGQTKAAWEAGWPGTTIANDTWLEGNWDKLDSATDPPSDWYLGRGQIQYYVKAKINQKGLYDPAAQYRADWQAILSIR